MRLAESFGGVHAVALRTRYPAHCGGGMGGSSKTGGASIGAVETGAGAASITAPPRPSAMLRATAFPAVLPCCYSASRPWLYGRLRSVPAQPLPATVPFT